jgi:hypothetical protein
LSLRSGLTIQNWKLLRANDGNEARRRKINVQFIQPISFQNKKKPIR